MRLYLLIIIMNLSVDQIYCDVCAKVNHRVDCGDSNSTESNCIGKGCCWLVANGTALPNCFYKLELTEKVLAKKKVFVHMMPWFETKASSGTGQWGLHWSMNTRNPDNVTDGVRDIASYYHPLIDVYASGDTTVIDWQLGLMKLSGVTGVLIDWPGTLNKLDYAANLENCNSIIARTKRHGLEFAVVYEDNNLDLGGATDKVGQAKADMKYLQSNYFSKFNYARLFGAPLLLDFGPQSLEGVMWDQAFSVFKPKPTFFILSDRNVSSGGSSVKGGMCWVWPDFMGGLNQFYKSSSWNRRFGCAYPGFKAFYKDGGMEEDIPWVIPYSVDTFTTTLYSALVHTNQIQLITWNDYGEGTIIEPTVEFGYQFLTALQKTLFFNRNQTDLEKVTAIFKAKQSCSGDKTCLAQLEKQHFDFVLGPHSPLNPIKDKVTKGAKKNVIPVKDNPIILRGRNVRLKKFRNRYNIHI